VALAVPFFWLKSCSTSTTLEYRKRTNMCIYNHVWAQHFYKELHFSLFNSPFECKPEFGLSSTKSKVHSLVSDNGCIHRKLLLATALRSE
jgi:hypothetical protein